MKGCELAKREWESWQDTMAKAALSLPLSGLELRTLGKLQYFNYILDNKRDYTCDKRFTVWETSHTSLLLMYLRIQKRKP